MRHWRPMMRQIAALALCGLTAGCGTAVDRNVDSLKIGAYSVVREVIHDGLIPAFTARWKSKTGREARFEESYEGSGAQARKIVSGFDADLAILSHEGDMQVLVKEGKVKPDWNSGPNRGILTHSLVVIGHRSGNPQQIKDWADLGRPGVGVLYPDPKTSGGARWNINAIYGAALLAAAGAGPEQANLSRCATSWPGSRPMSSTWTPPADRAWPISPSVKPAMRLSLMRTSCCSRARKASRFPM